MSTQSQNTETHVPARTKTLNAMPKTEAEANAVAVKAMMSFLTESALTATFHLTKGLRIGSGFAGKFVVNLCNSIAKNAKDEGNLISSLDVLGDLRNSANYNESGPNDTIKAYFTIGRINAYARILGKKHECVLSDKDVFSAIQLVSDKLFHAVATS